MKGSTTNVMRNRQEEQGPQSYWSTHEVFFSPAELPPPGKHQNNIYPSGLAVHHLAYGILLKYVNGCCPVKNGRNCTKEEIHVAVMRGPHDSALSDDTIAHFSDESKVNVVSKRARLVLYDDIKVNIPKQMKVSPIAAIPHKSKAFRSILDLPFSLKLTPQGRVPSENENSKKTAPGVAIDQIGHVILRFIHAFSGVAKCANIFQ